MFSMLKILMKFRFLPKLFIRVGILLSKLSNFHNSNFNFKCFYQIFSNFFQEPNSDLDQDQDFILDSNTRTTLHILKHPPNFVWIFVHKLFLPRTGRTDRETDGHFLYLF